MGRPEVAEKLKNPVTKRSSPRRVRRPDPGTSDVGWP